MKNESFYLIPVSGNRPKLKKKMLRVKKQRLDADKTRKAVKTIQNKVEKPTLGDLGALAGIKEKLQQEEKSNDDTSATPKA